LKYKNINFNNETLKLHIEGENQNKVLRRSKTREKKFIVRVISIITFGINLLTFQQSINVYP